jgi:hypothetical protein
MKLPIRQLAVATALALTLPATAQSCTGDIFANGVVNGADLGAMLSYWGPRTSDPFSVASDINGDGVITAAILDSCSHTGVRVLRRSAALHRLKGAS